MRTRVITFHGGQTDSDGLPEHFHRYFVVASKAISLGGASVASVVAITAAPQPPNAHFVAQNEEDAMKKAAAALRSLPTNKGLQESSSEN